MRRYYTVNRKRKFNRRSISARIAFHAGRRVMRSVYRFLR